MLSLHCMTDKLKLALLCGYIHCKQITFDGGKTSFKIHAFVTWKLPILCKYKNWQFSPWWRITGTTKMMFPIDVTAVYGDFSTNCLCNILMQRPCVRRLLVDVLQTVIYARNDYTYNNTLMNMNGALIRWLSFVCEGPVTRLRYIIGN